MGNIFPQGFFGAGPQPFSPYREFKPPIPLFPQMAQGWGTSFGLDERQLQDYHRRMQQGDVRSTPGAFGDTVYVPRQANDVDPMGARQRSDQYFNYMQKWLQEQKQNGGDLDWG